MSAHDLKPLPDGTLPAVRVKTNERHFLTVHEEVARHFQLRFEPPEPLRWQMKMGGVTSVGLLGPGEILSARVPTEAFSAELLVWPARYSAFDDSGQKGCAWDLDLRDFPSVSTLEGLQARLNNLGYVAGPIDGSKNFLIDSAILSYLHRLGRPSGVSELDAPARARLQREALG